MTTEDLTRAAKLIDGGWITLHRTSERPSPGIQVSAERLVDVHWLEQTIGGKLKRHGGLYWWIYGGKRAIVLLEEVGHLLKLRSLDAEQVIEAFSAEKMWSQEIENMLFDRNIARAADMREDQRPFFWQIFRVAMKERSLRRSQEQLEGR